MTGTGQTDHLLSCMVLGNSHSLPLQRPVFLYESAVQLGNRKTRYHGPNDYLITD